MTTAQTDIAKFGLGEAKKNLPAAAESLKGPKDFFTALMSGDRKTILDTLAPEVDTLTSQYDTGKKTAEEFAPRGGGRAAVLEELPFRKAGEINKMVQCQRIRERCATFRQPRNFRTWRRAKRGQLRVQ